jgi:hypothetical protein
MIKLNRLNEWSAMNAMTTGNFAKGLPFYGTKGDFNFTVGRSQFTPGISVKQVPLTDMSVKGDPGYSPFDLALSKVKMYFKPGDRVRGVIVNSQTNTKNGRVTVGKLQKITPDYKNGIIRAWVLDLKTLKSVEIYIDTIERIYENSKIKALSFNEFINS